jgi:hypothetical protein
MLVPCIIRRSRNNQHYTLNCTTPLFIILAATCFGGTPWHGGRGTALQTRTSRDRFPMVSLKLFSVIIPPAALWMTLGSNQPLTEMITGNIPGDKGCRCVGVTTLPPSCADCFEIWEPQPPGTLRACQGL